MNTSWIAAIVPIAMPAPVSTHPDSLVLVMVAERPSAVTEGPPAAVVVAVATVMMVVPAAAAGERAVTAEEAAAVRAEADGAL